jgi:L-alanine-DL-glutamate epimerase-like enolase superfamily enzyme
MPWMIKLFQETPPIVQGHLVLPNTPGLGLTFDEAALKSFRVA